MSFELVIIVVLSVISCVSSYYAIKFGLLLLRLEDDIEASLDDIDCDRDWETQDKLLNLSKNLLF